jgi:hypothetical protein
MEQEEKDALIDNLVRIMEHGRTVVIGEPTAISPTGEPYWNINSSGFKNDGMQDDAWFFTERAAIDHFEYIWNTISFNNTQPLYWRLKPTLESSDVEIVRNPFESGIGASERIIEKRTVYKVRARFLISSKPSFSEDKPHKQEKQHERRNERKKH